ncbi:MAG: CBS domain-containing protein [Methanosphaera sp.]|uniref:CBS domain-containing protein n=1 Tax=Methanosphaera sp. TaxID=2666342 RepID=UPI0025E2835C|nr:CBS domain-containing protein [Methanosphaera sp.]MCI5866839.1 CBS domain-containing protein [Methanosphaera sp.]MDD6534346.1 CBS domain-containing protein [Methanosphaera sp.]MDY3955249.1 CBS domain-containing protein [Methanosphaera sp.]
MKNKIIEKFRDDANELNQSNIVDIAIKDVIVAPASTSIINIANMMTKNNVRRIPITDPGSGKILGIITTMDILNFFGGGEKYKVITDKYEGNFLSAINAPIREIMTKGVKTLNIKDTIVDATTVMLESKIGGLPIVDDDDKLVGMLTEGDVVGKLKNIIAGSDVEDVMTSDVMTTTPGTRIEGVTKIMVRNSIRRIPIVGEDPKDNTEKLLGFITATDILKYIGDHKLFTELFSNEGNDVVDITIDKLMEKDVITTDKYAKTEDIIEIMEENDIKGVPVVDNETGKLEGIITVRDLLKTIIE